MHHCAHVKCCGNFGKNLVGPQISSHRWSNSAHIFMIHMFTSMSVLMTSSIQKEEATKY